MQISYANLPPPPTTDARRYFKQSEIILYRQAPDAVNGGSPGSIPAPPPPESKIHAVPG